MKKIWSTIVWKLDEYHNKISLVYKPEGQNDHFSVKLYSLWDQICGRMVKSSNLYPFMPIGYPKKMQVEALGSNLVLEAFKVDATAKHPKVLNVE